MYYKFVLILFIVEGVSLIGKTAVFKIVVIGSNPVHPVVTNLLLTTMSGIINVSFLENTPNDASVIVNELLINGKDYSRGCAKEKSFFKSLCGGYANYIVNAKNNCCLPNSFSNTYANYFGDTKVRLVDGIKWLLDNPSTFKYKSIKNINNPGVVKSYNKLISASNKQYSNWYLIHNIFFLIKCTLDLNLIYRPLSARDFIVLIYNSELPQLGLNLLNSGKSVNSTGVTLTIEVRKLLKPYYLANSFTEDLVKSFLKEQGIQITERVKLETYYAHRHFFDPSVASNLQSVKWDYTSSWRRVIINSVINQYKFNIKPTFLWPQQEYFWKVYCREQLFFRCCKYCHVV